jgi:TRAP-type C4-dicarboxylate transport system substrate-binding protein
MKKRNVSKSIGHISAVVVCLALIIFVAAARPALAQQKVEPITLNWASFVPATNPETVAVVNGFMNKAAELSKGRLAFRFRGGPETISLVDLTKATQSGLVDFSINLCGFVETVAPGVGGIVLTRISLDEERKNGTYEYVEQLCNKGGLHYMGSGAPSLDRQFFNLFLNKRVEKPQDFKGLRLGTATVGRAIIEAWGGVPVNMVLTDYYTAMERGTVDGVASSPASNWVASGCQAVTKYMALPGYLQTSVFVVMNFNTWNKLPPDLQRVVTAAMVHSERVSGEYWAQEKAKAIEKLKEAKVDIYNLPPDTAKWLIETAYEGTWAYQMKRFPNETPRLKALLSGGK